MTGNHDPIQNQHAETQYQNAMEIAFGDGTYREQDFVRYGKHYYPKETFNKELEHLKRSIPPPPPARIVLEPGLFHNTRRLIKRIMKLLRKLK